MEPRLSQKLAQALIQRSLKPLLPSNLNLFRRKAVEGAKNTSLLSPSPQPTLVTTLKEELKRVDEEIEAKLTSIQMQKDTLNKWYGKHKVLVSYRDELLDAIITLKKEGKYNE